MSLLHLAACCWEAIALGDIALTPANVVRYLDALYDTCLSMEAQVSSVVRSCNFHLQRLGGIWKRTSVSEHAM